MVYKKFSLFITLFALIVFVSSCANEADKVSSLGTVISYTPSFSSATLIPVASLTQTPTFVPTETPISIPTSTPTQAPTLTPMATYTTTPLRHTTFTGRDNGVVFIVPSNWDNKSTAGAFKLSWSGAELVVSDKDISDQNFESYAENLVKEAFYVLTSFNYDTANGMITATGLRGDEPGELVLIENALGKVTIFFFYIRNLGQLAYYENMFQGIKDSILIDLELVRTSPTQTPTHTPTPTPIPTSTPNLAYTHVNGDQIPVKTIAGTDSCDDRFSETAFCIELLVYEGVNEDHVQKAVDGLQAIVGRYPVSEAELTVDWPEFRLGRGTQSYLGYIIWDPVSSSRELILNDHCQFRWVIDTDSEKSACKFFAERALAGTLAGDANLRPAEFHSNGYLITSSSATYEEEIERPAAHPSAHFNDPRRTSSHEYFHAYQTAHSVQIFAEDESRSVVNKTGPNWLLEGSADYAALRVAVLEGWMYWIPQMREKMSDIQVDLAKYPNKSIEDCATPEQRDTDPLAYSLCYDLGMWAVAYAISISSQQAVMFDYWDDLIAYGYEESFTRNIGVDLVEFYMLFEEFRKKSLDEKLDVISNQINE